MNWKPGTAETGLQVGYINLTERQRPRIVVPVTDDRVTYPIAVEEYLFVNMGFEYNSTYIDDLKNES